MDDEEASAARTDGHLAALGRLGVALVALGVVLAIVVPGIKIWRHMRAPPEGRYCQRDEGRRDRTYTSNCVVFSAARPDADPATIGKVEWSTWPTHPRDRNDFSMRRGGKSSRGTRFDLHVRGAGAPVGFIDFAEPWVTLTFVDDPSTSYSMKSELPTFSSVFE